MDVKNILELPGKRVSTDTRTIAKGDVFFALKGPHFDGHDFIGAAIAKGATHLVVSDAKKAAAAQVEGVHFIVVEDTLKAYGDLAAQVRSRFKIPVIAVTGSSGKTTVKELLAHCLAPHFNVLKNKGTENNLIGVPKTILQLENAHQAMVLELGTNQPGEIDRLASIAAPQIGILTLIAHSHLQGLESLEGVKKEKLRLMHRLERGGHLILNGEDAMLADVQSGVHRTLRAGFSEGMEFRAERVVCGEKGSSFYCGGEPFETQLLGRHNILNCLLAIAAASSLGVEPASLRKSIASFKAVPGRMNLKDIDGISFIDDSYNSNPGSFAAALEALKHFKNAHKKGVVCGDMLELGDSSEALHRKIGSLIASAPPDFVIAAGPNCRHLVDEALKKGLDSKKIRYAEDAAAAGKICRDLASPGDLILVKGSRGMGMEKIFECFTSCSTR